MPGKGQPCTVDGVRYPSLSAAAKALGVKVGTLQSRLLSPNFPVYASERHPKVDIKPRGQPCTINGIEYVSEKGAARALGISLGSLLSRLRSSNHRGYVSRYRSKEKRRRHPIPCNIAGVEYASISDASRKLGITDQTTKRRLASPNFPDYASADITKKPPEPPKYAVRGKPYGTMREIAEAEGVTNERIRQKIHDPSYLEYQRL